MILIINKSKRDSNSLAEIKKTIQKASDRYDIVKELSLSSDTLMMLENSNKFEFDIFELHELF